MDNAHYQLISLNPNRNFRNLLVNGQRSLSAHSACPRKIPGWIVVVRENFISNEIDIYTILLGSVIFPYNSLYTQAVAYTTYFELGEPVIKTIRLIVPSIYCSPLNFIPHASSKIILNYFQLFWMKGRLSQIKI